MADPPQIEIIKTEIKAPSRRLPDVKWKALPKRRPARNDRIELVHLSDDTYVVYGENRIIMTEADYQEILADWDRMDDLDLDQLRALRAIHGERMLWENGSAELGDLIEQYISLELDDPICVMPEVVVELNRAFAEAIQHTDWETQMHRLSRQEIENKVGIHNPA